MELPEAVMTELEKFKMTFTNDNGNVMVSARNKLREAAVREMASLVAAKFEDGMVVTKDGVSVPLGIDRATEEVIWAHFEVTVNMKEPVPAPEKPAKKNKMF
jgi:hypothetical protein